MFLYDIYLELNMQSSSEEFIPFYGIVSTMIIVSPILFRCDVYFWWLTMNYLVSSIFVILLSAFLFRRKFVRINSIDIIAGSCVLLCLLHILFFSENRQLLLIANGIGYLVIYALFRNVSYRCII